MPIIKKTLIAELLQEKHLITSEQLVAALQEQKNSDKKIGQILVDFGYIEEPKLLQLLSEQLQLPYIDLKNHSLDPQIVKLLPEFYARHCRAIVIEKKNDHLLVGMVDPQDLVALDEIERVLKVKVDLALIRENDLLDILNDFYRRTDEISQLAESLSEDIKHDDLDIFSHMHDFSSEDLPVVNLLRSIFEDASQVDASDIHIEPGENIIRIRLRIDGVLHEQILPDQSISKALVQRIKLASGLNISEKRLPQDGRFSISVMNKKYDVRVSTLPVQYGESLVMRLLNQSADMLDLNQLDMPELVLYEYNRLLTISYGLLLIVGPTGSGKTTTLYASLNKLNTEEEKIITVEDPIEYRLPRINQVQVNTKINLTFASILRSILRQDPDIIMIGELRDQETMEIALRAAMTGHFVMATLHTNDTISAATRLLEMGAKGYLVASVLRGIMAQRLVRRICDKCKTDDTLSENEMAWLKTIERHDKHFTSFKNGAGCSYCHHTGYHGRVGVFELLSITDELIDALRHDNISVLSKLATPQPHYKPLVLSGLELVYNGTTTVREVIRMAGEV